MHKRTLKAKDRWAKRLLENPDVSLVAVGYKRSGGRATGTESVMVGVRRKVNASLVPPGRLVPGKLRPAWYSLRSVPTDVVEVGIIEAFAARTDRWRPSPGGVSVGHFSITAGTLGIAVMREGKRVILSNNHVLANSNGAQIGDEILQPGPHDGGKRPDDVLATLLDFVKINFEGEVPLPDQCRTGNTIASLLTRICKLIGSKTVYKVFDEPEPNLVDAAVAVPLSDADLDSRVLGEADEPTISVKGTAPLDVGMAVKKSGRTTGFKRGSVASVGASVRVQYGEGKTAVLEDQVTIEPAGFSAGGDSGSAILTEDDRIGGLLFAGSEQVTIANRIEHVFRLLKLNL